MLCERCKKNQATVHMKKIINGNANETHLCSECAGAENYNQFHSMFQDLFSFSSESDFWGADEDVKKCPVCNMTYDEFKRTGKLGCESCYEAFSSVLDNTLKSIHGSNEHKGKFPKKSGGKMLAVREKANLKRKLAVAIEKEEFEEAARLRDELKKLEGGGEQ